MPALDLESISRSVVKLRAEVPEDAFTAGVLGSQRTGNGEWSSTPTDWS